MSLASAVSFENVYPKTVDFPVEKLERGVLPVTLAAQWHRMDLGIQRVRDSVNSPLPYDCPSAVADTLDALYDLWETWSGGRKKLSFLAQNARAAKGTCRARLPPHSFLLEVTKRTCILFLENSPTLSRIHSASITVAGGGSRTQARSTPRGTSGTPRGCPVTKPSRLSSTLLLGFENSPSSSDRSSSDGFESGSRQPQNGPRVHHRCSVIPCLVGERDGNDDRARTLADERRITFF